MKHVFLINQTFWDGAETLEEFSKESLAVKPLEDRGLEKQSKFWSKPSKHVSYSRETYEIERVDFNPGEE